MQTRMIVAALAVGAAGAPVQADPLVPGGSGDAYGRAAAHVAGASAAVRFLQPPAVSDAALPAALLAPAQPLAAPAVPEPANWAFMLAGLGVVGALARRRNQPVVVAA